jgi:hypothetical protein
MAYNGGLWHKLGEAIWCGCLSEALLGLMGQTQLFWQLGDAFRQTCLLVIV